MTVQGKTHCSRCGIAFDNDESTVLTIRPIHYNARIRAKCFKLCPQCNAKIREVLKHEIVFESLKEDRYEITPLHETQFRKKQRLNY